MSGLNAEDERAGQQAAEAIPEATNYHSDEVTDASRSTGTHVTPSVRRPFTLPLTHMDTPRADRFPLDSAIA